MATITSASELLLRRVTWTIKRRLDGLLHGDYRTLLRGYGLDLADLREYQYGDDVRHIDWNVTARMQAPYVREFNEDRDVTAWFLLDLSASVDFGSGVRTKRAVATEFVTLLAQVLSQHGNRVGALFFGSALETVIPARTGRRHLLHLLDRMLKKPVQSAPSGTSSNSSGTDLAHYLHEAGQSIRRRSLVFVVSDFISSTDWGPALARLALRHEVIAVRLADPLESALPDLGMVTLCDAETGEHLLVNTHSAKFRERFATVAAAREERVRAGFAHAGVDALELSTSGDIADEVFRFAALRKRRAQLSGGGVSRKNVFEESAA